MIPRFMNGVEIAVDPGHNAFNDGHSAFGEPKRHSFEFVAIL
jgi:hypothetical protein